MVNFFRSLQKCAVALCLSFAFFFSFAQSAQAIDYAGGTYTNLCGTGHTANAHTCNRGCNTSTGSCSGSHVVKFVCDGRQGECKSNESGFSTSQSVSGVGCGKTVQIDVFSKNCRAGGGWSCGDSDLQDYIVWYSGDCQNNNPPPQSGDSCQNWLPVNTQFRKSGTSSWISGGDLSSLKLQVNDTIDANCFAKSGTALLKDARIEVRKPDGTTERINSPELRNYTITQNGAYSVSCRSTSMSSCNDTDSFTITNNQTSSCNSLSVTSGQDSIVPSTVKFRASGSDNKGAISRYRYFFGDGQQMESDQAEVEHRYEVSGNFVAKVEVKDTTGNWKSSTACETSVRVQPSTIESHRSGCSDLFIQEGNDTQAPSTAKFRVTGYDNKGSLQQFRVDFGNGVVKESAGEYFEQRYEQPGTYTIKGYIKDSQGNWKGGDSTCQRTLYIKTKPLTTQPETGTPTNLTILAVTSGFIGTVMLFKRHALSKK